MSKYQPFDFVDNIKKNSLQMEKNNSKIKLKIKYIKHVFSDLKNEKN